MGGWDMRKLLVGLVLACAAPVAAQEAVGWDGLVEVRTPRFEAGFVAPGADFRDYRKVMLDKPEVAFQRNWQRDVNASRRGSRRVTDQQAEQILATARSNFTDIFAEAFANAGFQVVEAPGPDVLRISPAVLDLVINAPDTMAPGRSRSFTANAGEATLVMEVRDSETNALMARVLDRRETRQMAGRANSVTNLADFRALARTWAASTVRGLEALRAVSPLPETLTPGQRLP